MVGKVQHYNNSSKLFFTSDTHFGHSNIIKYCNRPFSDITSMREELILRWNAKVPHDATVFHLGDFSFLPRDEVAEILNRLNGQVILVAGNHDDHKAFHLFEEVHEMLRIQVVDTKRPITLCHYPMLVWDKAHHGAWMLHGHCHGTRKFGFGKILDVGVDCHPRYEPFSYEEVERLMSLMIEDSVDGHGDPNNYGRPRVHHV